MSYIAIHEVTRTSGYISAQWGFIPTRQCRYILDISCSSASIGIGGVSFSLGSGDHQTVIVDSDASLQNAEVSLDGGATWDTYSYLYPKYNNEGLCFTPYSATFSGSGLTVHSVRQMIEDKGLVTAFGSNKHQALGSDGPNYDFTLAPLDIIASGGTATIGIDEGYYTAGGSRHLFLKELVFDHGFSFDVHFTEKMINWDWETAKTQMIGEHTQYTADFDGAHINSWCALGMNGFNENYKNEWVRDTFDVWQRSWRFGAQAITANPSLYCRFINDVSGERYMDKFLPAWEQGYAAIPVYTHDTDRSSCPQLYGICRTHWQQIHAYFDPDSPSYTGVIWAGYAHVYHMALSQVEATFQTSQSGGNILITPSTSGKGGIFYPCNVVVAVDAGTVTGVYQGTTPVEYSPTPDNYVTFEVENGLQYTVSTSGAPPPEGVTITIDSSMIDAELTDFPLAVRITDPAILSHDRKHISIEAEGSECYVEVERWESSEGILWVKVPTIFPSTDTVLTLSLLSSENPSYVGDTLDPVITNVWSNGYVSVFHLGGNAYDSGPARNHGTIVDDLSGTDVTFVLGRIGLGAQFKNEIMDSGKIMVPDHPEYSPINNDPWVAGNGITCGRICVQFQYMPVTEWDSPDYINWRVPLRKGYPQIEYKFNVFGNIETYGPRRFYVFSPSGGFGSGADLGATSGHLPTEWGRWYLLHGQTFKDTSNNGGKVASYEDGTPGFGIWGIGGDVDEDIGFNNYAYGDGVPGGAQLQMGDTDELYIGGTPNERGPPDGILDEVRISKVNRNKAWMKAELHNQNGELVTLTGESPPPPPPNQNPVASVNGPYSGQTGSAVAFSSSGSTDPDGTISSYSWDFGDEGSSPSANPSHTYSSSGTYTITLTVTDNDGATDSAVTSCTVTDPPPDEYTLTVSTVGQGTVAKSPDQPLYESGTPVQLTANPASEWQFSGWSGDLTGMTNPTSTTMDSNKVVTATFTSEPAPPPEEKPKMEQEKYDRLKGQLSSISRMRAQWSDEATISALMRMIDEILDTLAP